MRYPQEKLKLNMPKKKSKKILVISVSGIGNTVLLTPLLGVLRRNYPEYKIDFLTVDYGMADVVNRGGLVDDVFLLPKGFFAVFDFLFTLRKKKYDYSITAFPSNRWEFNALSFLIGARYRITHSYQYHRLRTLSFLQNTKIPAREGDHDVKQNINLLSAFGLTPEHEKIELRFYLSREEREFAEQFCQENGLEKMYLVGLHPGAGTQQMKQLQGETKRWPAEKFARLADRLIQELGVRVLIFGGQEELAIKMRVRELSQYGDKMIIVSGRLGDIAAVIKKCSIFISNDSGLMHIAAALHVPTVGIFGPTNSTRTAPFGKNCFVIKSDVLCKYPLRYPFYSTSSRMRHSESCKCLEYISVNRVFVKVCEIIIRNIKENTHASF